MSITAINKLMKSEVKKTSFIFILALIAIAALAVRLIHLYGSPMETRDGIGYINFTRQWFEGGSAALPSFGRMKPPLLCYLGKMLMYCRLSAATALLTLNLACGVLMVIPAYLIGHTLYDDREAGLWLAGISAVMPPLVSMSCTRERECLYLFLMFWIVWSWIMAMKRRRESFFAALSGILSVLAVYCRYEAVEFLLFSAVALPVAGMFPHWQWKRAGRLLLSVGSGSLAMALLLAVLPGMPDIWQIFYNRIYGICLGTSLNPL